MTQNKNTKRALLGSILAMLVCVAMLIGSTFAWFTDSVTSGNNHIVAGNLDVELEYRDADRNWQPVTENTQLFSSKEADGETANLWEPGHTEVVYLKVKNAGTLALKYQFAVNVAAETPGTNVYEESFRLSDYLVFGQAKSDGEIEEYTSREAAWAAAGDTLGLETYSDEQVLLPSAENYVALVVYMPTSVDNHANHLTGTDAPEITLGVNLVATQTPYESDSFGDDYDEFALYPGAVQVSTEEEFLNALQAAEAGAVIALTEDLALTTPVTISQNVTIAGNGQTISGRPITAKADVTFRNVTLCKPVNANNNASLVYGQAGCTELVFDGCTFSDPQWEAIQITSADFKTLCVTNCTFTAANVEGATSSYGNAADEAIRYIHIESRDATADITITGNTFKNCDKVKDSVVGIYYLTTDSTITVGGNRFENLVDGDAMKSGKLSVGWPEVEALKEVSFWTAEKLTTARIDAENSGIDDPGLDEGDFEDPFG